jgi:hypothetical protein
MSYYLHQQYFLISSLLIRGCNEHGFTIHTVIEIIYVVLSMCVFVFNICTNVLPSIVTHSTPAAVSGLGGGYFLTVEASKCYVLEERINNFIL